MSDLPFLLPWMFNLDGMFTGFVGDDLAKAKYISLEVEGERLAIKLPKALRESLRSRLQPGDYLRCLGHSHIDSDTGTIKLEAYQVFTLLTPHPTIGSHPTSPTPLPSRAAASPPRLKIQVCRKSGCQKRGGRELVTALQQVLRDRNLHHQIEIQYTGCQKRCSAAPTFTVMPGRHQYNRVKLPRLTAILDPHLSTIKPGS